MSIVAALAACDNGASPSPDSTPHVTATAAKPAQSATSSAPTPTATATAEAAPEALRPRYGTVMIEIGQRFETIGRAALANRWELAAFEADEMDELLDEDLRNAEPPKKGPTRALAGMADSFRGMHVAALKRAVKARDKKAFNEAFSAAAAACNGCHDSSSHRFIEIASAPGKPVLVLDPLPATK